MRGGKRKGAGRKPTLEHLKRERITIRLPRFIIKWLKRHKNQGKIIESALKASNKSLNADGRLQDKPPAG